MRKLVFLFFVILLSACSDGGIEDIEGVVSYEYEGYEVIEDIGRKDNNVDYIFKKAISDDLQPFSFHVFGEITDDEQIWLRVVYIYDYEGNYIQAMRLAIFLEDIAEDSYFGMKFYDSNQSGFLDIFIRRLPDGQSGNRPYRRWLWDNDIERFEYDSSVSGVFTLDMPAVTVHVLGRWFDDSNNFYLRPNIDTIQVKNHEGELIQEFDGLRAYPALWLDSYGVHFADYNFDGFLDMVLSVDEGGSMRNSPSLYWLWDNEQGKFVYNNELSDLSNHSTIEINEGHNSLWASWHGGGMSGGGRGLRYIDGVFVEVSAAERDYVELENGELALRTRGRDLLNGTWETTYSMITRYQIHEDLPEFTFSRTFITGSDQSLGRVSIMIYENPWDTIQEISGLYQSDILSGIELEGLTMRLDEYFWVWEGSQFVMKEEG